MSLLEKHRVELCAKVNPTVCLRVVEVEVEEVVGGSEIIHLV